MIDWDIASSVSDVVAAIAVVVSILYLATQIRESRKESRVNNIAEATEGLNSIFLEISTNSDTARIFYTGLERPSELPKDEFSRFNTLFSILVGRYGEVFFRWESGSLPDDYWEGCVFNLKGLLNTAGGQLWVNSGAIETTSKNYRSLILEIAEQGPLENHT